MHYGRHFIAEISDELELTEMRLGGEDYVNWNMDPVGVIDGREVYYNPDGRVTRVAYYEYGDWIRDE